MSPTRQKTVPAFSTLIATSFHEVTSPQAFEGLRMTGRKVRNPEKTIAVPDHNVPTTQGRENPDQMPEESRIQVAALTGTPGLRHPLLPRHRHPAGDRPHRRA